MLSGCPGEQGRGSTTLVRQRLHASENGSSQDFVTNVCRHRFGLVVMREGDFDFVPRGSSSWLPLCRMLTLPE
jgi:hypothetical protein